MLRCSRFVCAGVVVALSLAQGCTGKVVEPPPARSGGSRPAVQSPLLLSDFLTGLTGFEPTMAVDPANQNVLVVARGCNAQVSSTGPAGFGPVIPMVIPGTHACGGDDVLTFDSQGRAFLTFLGFRNNTPPPPGMAPSMFNNRPDVFVQQIDPARGILVDAAGNDCAGA